MDTNFTCKYNPSIKINFFWEDLDDFRCALATLSLILYKVNFGYICAFLLLLIAVISIFGGIKSHYRWYILNQVFWDALMTYKFIWFNYIKLWFYLDNSCYRNVTLCNWLEGVPNASYSALLLLSFSRFLSLYFENLYKRFTKNHRIFLTIFIYNFIIIITSLYTVTGTIADNRIMTVLCLQTDMTEFQSCYLNPPEDITYKVLMTICNILTITSIIKPPLCLLLSIISTIMIILKISKRLKFQLKNNKKEFYISLRITSVIAFQTFLYSFIFCFGGFWDSVVFLKELGIVTAYPNVPRWYLGKFSLTDPPTINSFNQIRIFLESLIVLFIMGGYREAVSRFFKFIFAYFVFIFTGKTNTAVTALTQINVQHNALFL